jgi:hypothetical protein
MPRPGVDVQNELALRLKFFSAAEHTVVQRRVDRIGRMLNGLIVSLQPDYWDVP